MNTDKHLIIVNGDDRTAEIKSCRYEGGQYKIVFNNNDKQYKYNYQSIKWLKDPRRIDVENIAVYDKDQPLYGITKILVFEGYVRIGFGSGYQKVFKQSDIIIEETCLANKDAQNCFEYLEQLSVQTSIKTDEDKSFLRKQYERCTIISPRSVLSAYLERKLPKKADTGVYPIFPFGFNLSQKAATEKALAEQVSVIEGPPGTGKTQTILNIIASAIMESKTVAVVSNNNSATENVLEKLQKYGVGFIAAFLGNKENRNKFFAEQSGMYPDMSDWALPYTEIQSIRNNLVQSQQTLNEMLGYQNEQAIYKQELSVLITEYEYFNKYYEKSITKPLNIRSFIRTDADRILAFILKFQTYNKKGRISFWQKLINFFEFGMYNFSLYKYEPELVISLLQKTYYDIRISWIERRTESLSKRLENYSFSCAMEEYSNNSMKLFKAKLAEKFTTNESRQIFRDDVLWKDFGKFISEYPVILSTTHSLRNCACDNYLFDYVIIDEASQVDLVTGALALSCAKNAVIVGDTKQLPNVVPPELANTTNRIFEEFDLNDAYNYADHSLLSSITHLYENIPKTLLKEHYRCHPKIIEFCNQKFYNNQLIILTNEGENDKPLIVYKTAKGNHARGKMNQRQIDVVFKEIIPEQDIDFNKISVGIVSPYRLQADELQNEIGDRNIEADTVHKYQGREKDVIILTTVDNEIAANDFVDNPNLVNVAVSRAVKQLIVVVSADCEEWKGTNIGDLVRYVQYNNFDIIESQIYSVFDLLYSNYSEKLLKMFTKGKNVSKYKSENLMNALIENVLSLPEFQSLDRVIHHPLRMLIRDSAKLSTKEYQYVMNIFTHIDFVIFNKLDKMPVLAIEVDGHAFHANNPVQLERDNMKDNILKKYSIPCLRIKTNESSEEERIRNKLMEILMMRHHYKIDY